jgi:hypothetical protein
MSNRTKQTGRDDCVRTAYFLLVDRDGRSHIVTLENRFLMYNRTKLLQERKNKILLIPETPIDCTNNDVG